jgi:hypothetical protein
MLSELAPEDEALVPRLAPALDPDPLEEPAPLVAGDPLKLPVASRTYFSASSAPRETASRALSYISRPRSAHSPAVSDAFL